MNKTKKIKNLAFCGGGFYGIAEVAAMAQLEKYKKHFDIQNIKGVSVGSIVAALYSVGYTPTELTKIMFEMDFDNLIKDTTFTYYKLWEKFGMYEAGKLEDVIESMIRVKTNIKFCTFAQIEKNLTIIATNLNFQRAAIFNKEHTPNMSISKAVRLSIGYPGIMTPMEHEGELYSDGGIFMNYPISSFNDEELEETLGLTFSSHNENRDGTLKEKVEIKDLYEYIGAVTRTLCRSLYQSQITTKHLERSVVIHITENISSMQFGLTMDQKKLIYDCGTKAMIDQLPKILGIESDDTDLDINYSENSIDTPLENHLNYIINSANEKETRLIAQPMEKPMKKIIDKMNGRSVNI